MTPSLEASVTLIAALGKGRGANEKMNIKEVRATFNPKIYTWSVGTHGFYHCVLTEPSWLHRRAKAFRYLYTL